MRLTEQTRVIEVKRSLVGIVVSRRRTYEQERVSHLTPLKQKCTLSGAFFVLNCVDFFE